MSKDFYKRLVEDLPIGYAYHKIVTDDYGNPVDYQFLEVNTAFENFTGLNGSNIIGEKICDIIPNLREDTFDWVKEYGEIAISGGSREFEQYSTALNKWYRVNAYSPEKYYFITFFTDITKETNELIEHKMLLTALNDGVFELNEAYIFENVIAPKDNLLFYPKDKIIGRSIEELFTEDMGKLFTNALEKAAVSLKKETIVYPSLFEAEKRWFKANIKYIEVSGRKKYVVNISDITEQKYYEEKLIENVKQRKLMEDALYLEKEKFQMTLLSMGDGVISVDKNQNIILLNSVAEQLTGWCSVEAEGKFFGDVFNIINERTNEKSENPIKKVLETGKVVELDNHTALIRKDGSEISIEDSAAPIKDKFNEIQGAVLVFRDVTEKKKVRNEIEYLSFHDYLTGLYNRRFFEEELLRLDTERNLPLSILMLDVNGLKLTNDAFGHEMGDALLKKVADIIKNSCRAEDIYARTGGDEFSVILPKTDSLQAELIRNRIIAAAAKETLEPIIISVAIGYDTKVTVNQDINETVKNSENCMYKDKIKTSRAMRNQTLQLIIETLNKKYEREQAHTERVCNICHNIGSAMCMTQNELRELETAGFLHDIGKIMVQQEILNKKGKLTEEEYEIIKRHSEAGYQILKSVEEYSALAEYVLCHHERWDGNGYPRRLKGENIPLISRIITVADAFEAMTAERLYRRAMNTDEAVLELRKNAGSQFDSEIVKVFIEKVLNYNEGDRISEETFE